MASKTKKTKTETPALAEGQAIHQDPAPPSFAAHPGRQVVTNPDGSKWEVYEECGTWTCRPVTE